MYKKQISLNEPISSDKQGQIDSVTLVLPKFSDYETAFISANGSDEKLSDLLIGVCSGLTQSEIERLKTPDYNAIDLWVGEHTTKPSEYFFALNKETIEKDNPKLLSPIKGFDNVQLSTPSVKASRMMAKVENNKQNPFGQGKYLLTACSELMDDNIQELAMPDWNQIQRRLNDFLNQASDFFQSQT